jgi:glycosyltransferase involved in cell wall biosynthesis
MNPASGGPAAAVATLIEFSPSDCVNEVVTLDAPHSEFLPGLAFTVHPLGPVGTKYGYSSKLVPWLRANADRFDGVVVHGLWQYCGLAVKRALGGRKPYMVYVHGMLDPYFKRAFPLKHIKKWLYWTVFEHWVLRDAFRVLFTCAEEERLARQSFGLNHWTGHVARHGAHLPEGDPDLRKAAFLARFPQLDGRRYLLFLGRIDKKKGCDLLIDAFLQIAARDPGPDSALDLVMAGPDEKHWSAQLSAPIAHAGLDSRVHWPGMLSGDEKWGAFLASEAFVLPSHQENFGIAVAEALACGKPVLISDKVNIASEIEQAGAGLVQTDTAAGTLRLLEDWIATPPEQRSDMARKARQLFERSYDMRINTRAITHLFRQAMRPHAPASVATPTAVE